MSNVVDNSRLLVPPAAAVDDPPEGVEELKLIFIEIEPSAVT